MLQPLPMKCGKGKGSSNSSGKKCQKVSIDEKPLDLTLKKLLEKDKKGKGFVYAYVVRTAKYLKGRLCQAGCGPNLEGGIITLCTCKHKMRTYFSKEDWVGKWVAGFTGINAVDKRNYLFYLIRVEKAFDSHMCLWNYLEKKVRSIKSTNKNPLGDVYEPKAHAKDRFNPYSYKCLHKDHRHQDGGEGKNMANDIDHEDRGKLWLEGKMEKKVAALLVGDQNFSFVWEKPTIFLKDNNKFGEKGLVRANGKYDDFKNFLNVLKEA